MDRRSAALLILLALPAASAWASGDCKGQSCNSSGGGDVTTGDVTSEVDVDNVINNTVTGGSTSVVGGDTKLNNETKTFAFSHSLGGVSIEDCLASTQWGTILFSKQKVVLNKWCAAEVYDAKGLHHMAALTRCDIEEIAKFFSSPEECVAANTLSPVISVSEFEGQQQVIQEQVEEISELQGRLADVEAKLAKPPRPTQRIVQQEYLNAEKRAALRAVLTEEGAE